MADRILFLETPDIPKTPVGEEQGSGGAANAVLYTPQSLTDSQKAQARTNVGAASMADIPSLAAYRTASAQDAIDAAQDSAIAAKYTKPSSGIPASDLADGVIPAVPVTGVSVNGTALTPQDGVVDVAVPTDYVNTVDFEDRTGSMRIVLSYSNGVVAIERSGTPLDTLIYLILNNCNVWFLLPTAYITGIPSSTDMMRFWMTGANLDTSAPTVSLTSEYGGKVYHAVLSPVSEYRMEGQLNVYNIALPSAESNSFGGA